MCMYMYDEIMNKWAIIFYSKYMFLCIYKGTVWLGKILVFTKLGINQPT